MNTGAQHQIDWYPWSGEAFAAAARTHKPMLISIGTVGDGSLYTGREAARLVDRHFIPVRVDRRALPGVAAAYGQAAGLLSGWKEGALEVLADGQGKPFYLFCPAHSRELVGVLSRVALGWAANAAAYEAAAAALHKPLLGLGSSVSGPVSPLQLWHNHYVRLCQRMDAKHGGFGVGGKLLQPQELLFLMDYARYTGDKQALEMACFTLRAMAMGAVRDQIGGGFFRGTADARWEKPIPEKRLVDQAWMLRCYTQAYGETGESLFRQVAAETADFVLRELRQPHGGFDAAQWAEADYYALTARQVRSALGDNDGSVFCREYSVGDSPSIPHRFNGEAPAEDTPLLHELRMKLYRARLEQGAPRRDEMLLLGQNGIMLGALAYAGRVLGVARYLAAASAGEELLRDRLVTTSDLLRYEFLGCSGGEAALEDYAGYAMGLWELYRSGCGSEYLRHAAKVMARADALFSDREGGGYYLCRNHSTLPVRPKQFWDGDVPSAWGVALKVLVQLAREIPHTGLRRRTRQLLEFAAGAARSYDCGYALTAMMDI